MWELVKAIARMTGTHIFCEVKFHPWMQETVRLQFRVYVDFCASSYGFLIYVLLSSTPQFQLLQTACFDELCTCYKKHKKQRHGLNRFPIDSRETSSAPIYSHCCSAEAPLLPRNAK